MLPFRRNESDDVTVWDKPSADARPETPSDDAPPKQKHEGPAIVTEERVPEHEKLLAKVGRLERELERYRVHERRTGQVFLSVTKYAEWVRENARRDAELALRKARARAEKLSALVQEREQTAREVEVLRDELARLQALTEETRSRLSDFLAAGLQALNPDVKMTHADTTEPVPGDLQATLQERVTATNPAPAPAQPEG